MKKTLKKFVSLLCAAVLLLSMSAASFAREEKQYKDYGTYVLLGDSVASGYKDFYYVDSEFKRVDPSYAAFVADDLGVELIPMACPGFRTVELRHIFEDDYVVEDDYLYTGSHMSNAEIDAKIPEIRKAVSEAGLITLGVGGNDWGAYLGWVATDIMEQEGVFADFVNAAKKYMAENGVENDTLNTIIDLADTMDALPGLIEALPQALAYGLSTYLENWDHMIADIYELNPDVTLLVMGMFDTGVKTPEDAAENEAALLKFNIAQTIVDIANKPMIESAEKFGYTFVDLTGTTCDDSHPNEAGHRYIADRILEALPDARFGYEDVKFGDKAYKAIEYLTLNGIMEGRTENLFMPDEAITKAELSKVVAAFTDDEITEDTANANVFDMISSVLKISTADGFDVFRFFGAFLTAVNIIKDKNFNILSEITRAEAAMYIYNK